MELLQKIVQEDCARSCNNFEIFQKLRDQTILITGGTGFMGKWVAEMISYLNVSGGYNIRLYLIGRDIKRFNEEVPHLANLDFITFIEQDIRHVHSLPTDVNHIIHAAGSPDSREHISYPLRTLETYYKGTNAILDLSSRLPDLRRIVHISSHMIYGEFDSSSSIDENYVGRLETSVINNVYAESKRIAETLCSIYRSQFKLPIVVLRPFAFIGPYQGLDKPWAVNNFIRDGILGEPIRILGNGNTMRTYLYGSDMAYWILSALTMGPDGEVYNIGGSIPTTLEELAVKIRSALNSNIDIVFKSSKSTYLTSTKLVPNVTKAFDRLLVKESYTLEDAIKRTILWNQLKNQIKINEL